MFATGYVLPPHTLLSGVRKLAPGELFLVDSGGQYLDGTTDITRVWPIGTPSAAQRRDYTLVLKGTMALSRARFPRGTLSPMLDALARAPLWDQGIEFGRGTKRPLGVFETVTGDGENNGRTLGDLAGSVTLEQTGN